MKKLLLVLFMTGCTAQASTPDMSKSNVYIDARISYTYAKYYPACVRLCFKNTYSDECPAKCKNDFKEITKVLIRSIKDNTEDDFDAMMDSWYGF